MNDKNNSSKNWEKGVYKPLNPEKYKGSFPIVYRSKWEKKLMIWLDKKSDCLSWGSESCVVSYIKPTDKKSHRYFIDFTATFKKRDGSIEKFYIEVKPYKQTIPPKCTQRKKRSTYLYEYKMYKINLAKWKAAYEFAKSRGCKFIVMTEKHLLI